MSGESPKSISNSYTRFAKTEVSLGRTFQLPVPPTDPIFGAMKATILDHILALFGLRCGGLFFVNDFSVALGGPEKSEKSHIKLKDPQERIQDINGGSFFILNLISLTTFQICERV